MCGRYYTDEDVLDRVMANMVNELNRVPVKTGEIFPGDKVFAAANSRAMNIRAFPMEWGFTGRDGKRIINARSETAAEKPIFRESLACRRCLLPAKMYYEWDENHTKFAIRPQEEEVFFLAGLYRTENGKPVFSILTRPASDSVAEIHHRMPVILRAGMMRAWMNNENDPVRMMNDAVKSMMWEKVNG